MITGPHTWSLGRECDAGVVATTVSEADSHFPFPENPARSNEVVSAFLDA